MQLKIYDEHTHKKRNIGTRKLKERKGIKSKIENYIKYLQCEI